MTHKNNFQVGYPLDTLYHYTDVNAFKSILENKNIRLTHYEHLNDTTEGKLIYEEVIKQSQNPKYIEEIYNNALKNFHICSFSSIGNLLSQWRGYGNVCIGFDSKKLEENRIFKDAQQFQHRTSGAHLIPCEYIDPCNKLDIEKQTNNFKDDTSIRTYHTLTLGLILFRIKHIGFKEEHEHRIIHYLYKVYPFKQNDKPYIEYHFNPHTITKIIVGPHNQQDDFNKINNFLKDSKEYKHVKVDRSTIPYI